MFEKTGAFIAIIGISIAFAAVSLFVIISGRNRKFISWKLKLGALLLTFTAGSAFCQSPMVTCYEPMRPDYVSIDTELTLDNRIIVSLARGKTISGMIHYSSSYKITYSIIEIKKGEKVQSGIISKEEGTFYPDKSIFVIKLGNSIKPGDYKLQFYKQESSEIKSSKIPWSAFDLTVQ